MNITKIGAFYEAYDDDAKQLAELLGLTLCKRGNRLMAGFPYHAINSVSTGAGECLFYDRGDPYLPTLVHFQGEWRIGAYGDIADEHPDLVDRPLEEDIREFCPSLSHLIDRLPKKS